MADNGHGPPSAPDWFGSTEEVAAYLGIVRSTLDNWARAGTGPPFYQVGTGRKYDRGEVASWLAAQRRPLATSP